MLQVQVGSPWSSDLDQTSSYQAEITIANNLDPWTVNCKVFPALNLDGARHSVAAQVPTHRALILVLADGEG